MIDYRAPVEWLLFAMRSGADAARLPDWDDGTARHVLIEAARFIEREIAPLDPVGDANPARLVAGRVHLPQAFVTAYRRFQESGWASLSGAEEYGGQGLPHVIAHAASEMLAGACVSFQMVLGLAQGAVRAIAANGSAEQRAHYLPKLISGEWLATMCLTEAQAGSDLGTIRTMAEPQGDGHYRVTGSKIFISGGDQNLTDNIVHLVLARTPGAAPGVRGLSLLLCPAVLPDGHRNTVACVRLEEKMGMHASPTCQMAFDAAQAELLGSEGQGLAHMFVMMNAERLDTGLQGVGLGEVAGQRSRAYAAERRQGRDEQEAAVMINRHADVRRMLLAQMALTQGCRALLYRTSVQLELRDNPDLVDLLTPVCKAFATDSAVDVAQLAIQIHGGYGYLKEYRVEQVLRDVRITTIYEGTNGIQAHTLTDRILRRKAGAPAYAFRAEIEASIEGAAPKAVGALQAAADDWQRATDVLLGRARSGAAATAYLRLTGLLAVGAMWARMEASASESPNPARTLAVAQYYRDCMLVETTHLKRLILQAPENAGLAALVFEGA